jgi:hypothetical protein
MYFKIMSGPHGGSGSALDPPGYPTLTHSLYGWGSKSWATRGGVSAARYIGSVKALTEADWAASEAGPVLRGRARRMFEEFDRTKIISEMWVQSVYAYFRNCYSPDGADRNVSHCEIWKPKRPDGSDCPMPPDERHLAYLHIREYFPDYAPRHDLILNPVSTTGKCLHCGQPVQYEARKDALCVAYRGGRWVYDETCPDSESGHEI